MYAKMTRYDKSVIILFFRVFSQSLAKRFAFVV